MKNLFILIVLSLFLGAAHAQETTTITPVLKWKTVLIADGGIHFQLATNAISPLDKKGNFRFLMRGIFPKPLIIEFGPGTDAMAAGFLIVSNGNCTTKQSVIVGDTHFTPEGKGIFQNELSKRDKLSVPAPTSIHGIAMNFICGKKAQNV